MNIKVTTLKPTSTSRKLRATWTSEMGKDLTLVHFKKNSIRDVSLMFEVAKKLTEKFPIGSKVSFDTSSLLDVSLSERTYFPLVVKSDFVPNMKSNKIVFLCNKSTDEVDFYSAEDILEFGEIYQEAKLMADVKKCTNEITNK